MEENQERLTQEFCQGKMLAFFPQDANEAGALHKRLISFGYNLPDSSGPFNPATWAKKIVVAYNNGSSNVISTTTSRNVLLKCIACTMDQFKDDYVYQNAADVKGKGAGLEDEQVLEAAAEEFNSMIGIQEAKKEIRHKTALARLHKAKKEMGLNVKPVSRHLMFVGDPGTGKTTCARSVGAIYHSLGLLDTPEVMELTRKDLVGAHIGRTEEIVKEILEKAKGKALFIDEAYSLNVPGTQNDFGQQVITELVSAMENGRENFMIILAGYPDKMKEFVDSNPGLKSRFKTYVHFESFSKDELGQILDKMLQDIDAKMTPEARQLALEKIQTEKTRCEREDKERRTDPSFGNGRVVRNLVELAEEIMAVRLEEQGVFSKNRGKLDEKAYKESLKTITAEDVAEVSLENINNEKKSTLPFFGFGQTPEQRLDVLATTKARTAFATLKG